MRFTPALVLLALSLAAGTAAARPGEVQRSLPAPVPTATGLAWDGARLWLADHGLDELVAVDPATGQAAARWKSPGHRPAGLAFDGQELWCADVLAARLFRLRPSDGLVTRSIPAPVKVPRALAFDGRALWVADEQTRAIHRVDPEDGTTLHELPFPSRSVDALAWDGRYLWVADRLLDRLLALEPARGEVVVSLPAPGPHVTGLAFDGPRLWTVDYQTDRLSLLDRDADGLLPEGAPREARVRFTHEVRNLGPDPLPEVLIHLALPRGRETQELLEDVRVEPAPFATETDEWGQAVARLRWEGVPPAGAVRAVLTARLRARAVRHVVWPEKVQGLRQIPADIRRRYLGDAPKLDLGHPYLVAAAREAVGQEKNPYWIARGIYRLIHARMRYELVGGWDAAAKVLERGTGSCSEYAFVFIALCRAAGLPARWVGSLVVRQDDASYDDVYHRWVEVYLPPYGWVPVDPSRGDKPTQAERADGFGFVEKDFLITTEAGGGSRLLGWDYNAHATWTCRGRCRVEEEGIAEWTPAGDGLESGRGLPAAPARDAAAGGGCVP
ncbi:MAG TPA: transglutaminase domain-containing protein [Myxococcota bacterium]|nr:transglutaminase domain-containing protein [Myxococcota bacterium]HRY93018.1 transglutaminase domain-containing protein [Myxococcota bacterium]HSA20249.1 transglutaminase domain-containing protein [Myxococcota bacterium]